MNKLLRDTAEVVFACPTWCADGDFGHNETLPIDLCHYGTRAVIPMTLAKPVKVHSADGHEVLDVEYLDVHVAQPYGKLPRINIGRGEEATGCLTPGEARKLAAALLHAADAIEKEAPAR